MKVRIWCLLLEMSLVFSLNSLAVKGQNSDSVADEKTQQAQTDSDFENQDLFTQKEDKQLSQLITEAVELTKQGKTAKAIVLIENEKIAERLKHLYSNDHPDLGTMLNFIGELYYSQRRYFDAEPLFVEALAMRQRLYSEDHSDIAISLNNLAKVYKNLGKLNQAEPLFVEALEITKRLYPNDNLKVATSINDFARFYYELGEYSKAESFYLQALEMRKRLYSGDHRDVAVGLNSLAVLYTAQGEYSKAESFYLQALEMRKRLYSDDNREIALGLSNLGELYHTQGKFSEAESFYLQALEMRKRLYSDDQVDLARSYVNLGSLYNNQARYGEAKPLLDEALAMIKRLFPQSHPKVASILHIVGSFYEVQGKYAEAEKFYVEAKAIYKEFYSIKHPETIRSFDYLANIYSIQDKYSEAESLLAQVLAIRKQLLSKKHPDIAASLNSLGLLYTKQGRYAEAESLLIEALKIIRLSYSGDHYSIANYLGNLGSVYGWQGEYKKAEPLHIKALEMKKRLYSGDHPSVASSLNILGLFYEKQGEYSKAEPVHIEALEMRKRLYSGDHPDVATSLHNLANVYLSQKRYLEAESFYTEALQMDRKFYSDNHLYVSINLRNLGRLYQTRKKYSQAFNYLTQASETEEAIIAENLLVGSEQQKKQFLNLFQESTDSLISFHLQDVTQNRAAAELALTIILRRKGRVLDATGQTLQTLRDNLDPKSEQLIIQLASTQTQLANLSSRPLPENTTQRDNIRTKQNELDEEIKQLEAQLSSRSAEFAQQTTPVTIEQVQQAIPSNAALVEFIQYKPSNPNASYQDRYGEPRYAVYVLLPDRQIRWQDLGEASAIDTKIECFRESLNSGSGRGLAVIHADSCPKALNEYARELDELVMKPVRSMVGDASHLLLSPDSQLNTLPFAALVDEQDKYLAENYLITYLTSGRDLLRLQLNQNQDTSQPLLIANPTYSSEGVAVASADIKADKENSTRSRRSGELGKLEFTSLPGTKVEGEAIKELVPNIKVYTEQEASENNLKQTKNPEFLHLATHGFFLPPQEEELNNDRNGTLSLNNQTPVFSTAENPLLRSGLAPAGFNQRDSGAEDGVLTALEVTGLNLRGTKLVVMSACETGLGDVQAGEGVYGLRRAFTLAGAQSQLMSLWSVSDEGTKDLMVEYYRRIQNGEARGEALRQVQLEMLNNPDRNHPFFWAAFIPSGSWLPLDSGS